VEPARRGWLTGRYRENEQIPASRRAERLPGRYDLSIAANQRKLEAADTLGALPDETERTHDISTSTRSPGIEHRAG